MSENEEIVTERTRLIPAVSGQRYTNDDEESVPSIESTAPAKRLPQYVAALTATGGALAAGTILGWTSPAEAELVTNSTANDHYDFPISPEQYSWVGGLVALGATLVCIPAGFLTTWLGRKWTMLLLVIPFTIGWLLIIFAQNIWMMYIGRFILGIAGGAFCVTTPIYTCEIAQNEIRGTTGTFFQLMITTGILFVYGVGAAVNVFILSIICAIIPLIFGVIFFFMPESPTHFVSKGCYEDALQSLKRLRGDKYNVIGELEQLQAEHQASQASSSNLGQALMRKESIRSAFVSLGLMFFQQMSGINAVIFYTARIFSESGSKIPPHVATIIVGTIQVVATFIANMVVDRVGRRFLLLLSIIVMGFCLLGLAIYFDLLNNGSNPSVIESLQWLPITSLCIFITAFSLGFGPIPWLMVGELFAPDIKGFVGAVAGTMNWLLAFIITKFFVNLQAAFGNGPTFWFFVAFCCLGFVFVGLFVPETKGKSLQAIQEQLKLSWFAYQ